SELEIVRGAERGEHRKRERHLAAPTEALERVAEPAPGVRVARIHLENAPEGLHRLTGVTRLEQARRELGVERGIGAERKPALERLDRLVGLTERSAEHARDFDERR